MESKQWWMSCGIKGGEFAMQAASFNDAQEHLIAHLTPYFAGLGTINIDIIRPCPPELVEWIEAKLSGNGWHPAEDGRAYCKPGGWKIDTYEDSTIATVYVPVAGAAGLTIIGDSPST